MDSPEADILIPEAKLRFWKKTLKVSIGLMVVPPLIGCAGTVVGMIKAFNTLSLGDETDPGILADDVSFALTTTAVGLVFSLVVGFPVFVVSLTKVLRLR